MLITYYTNLDFIAMFNSRYEPGHSEDFYALHQKGSLALHLNVHPALYNDKFDNPCITNNEREDGGSPLNKDLGYTLHLIVSASVLPTPEYRVEQRLYENTGRYFFIGLNIEKCRINHFEVCDSHTTYQITNKHQRPSYKPTLFTDRINRLPHEQRVQYVHNKNKASAEAVSYCNVRT